MHGCHFDFRWRSAVSGHPCTAALRLQAQDVVATTGLWNDNEIAQWAREQSPLARLYEAESRANLASIDRDDRSQCAQAHLIQRVYNDLACFERHEAAMKALKNASQIRAFGAAAPVARRNIADVR